MLSRNDLSLQKKLVKKSDRLIERFDKEKLKKSIAKTLHHLGKHEETRVTAVTYEVCFELSKSRKRLISVEDIRRTVTRVFKKRKMTQAARYYDLVFLHMRGLKVKRALKRDGRRERFSPFKIFKAIRKSLSQAGIEDGKKCEMLTKEVVSLIDKKYASKIVPVENIKEDIEYVFVKHKLPKVARLYLLYRYM